MTRLSPSQYKTQMADLEKRCEAARRSGDIELLQRLLERLTRLIGMQYG